MARLQSALHESAEGKVQFVGKFELFRQLTRQEEGKQGCAAHLAASFLACSLPACLFHETSLHRRCTGVVCPPVLFSRLDCSSCAIRKKSISETPTPGGQGGPLHHHPAIPRPCLDTTPWDGEEARTSPRYVSGLPAVFTIKQVTQSGPDAAERPPLSNRTFQQCS